MFAQPTTIFLSRLTDIMFNSLVHGRVKWKDSKTIFQLNFVIDNWDVSCKIVLWGSSRDLINDEPTLVQVMAWCRQKASCYLNQVYPDLSRSMMSLDHNELTHWGLIKMVDILLRPCVCIFIHVSLNIVRVPLIGNKSTLVLSRAWHRTGHRPIFWATL